MTIAPERRYTGSVLDLPDPGHAWRSRAACQDTDPETFSISGNAHPYPEAVDDCAACPVRHECLIDACRAGDTATYRGGMTPPERHRWVIAQGLKPAGFISDASQKPLTRSGPRRDVDTATIVALVQQGLGFHAIAARIGCSDRTAQRRYLAWQEGQDVRLGPSVSTEDVVAARLRGDTIRQIAAALGCSPATVQQRLKDAKRVQP